jgi:hypothetical protein
MSAPQCLDEGPPACALRFQGKTGAIKAEAIHNHAEGANMAQEVIVYSNVGCGPCHQAMEYLSQKDVPFIEKEECGAGSQRDARPDAHGAALVAGPCHR